MELLEKTAESRRIFDGRVVHLRRDLVDLPNGASGVREVVDHPGGVAIVALDEAQNVFLVRQYRYAIETVLTEIPAGKREPEEDPALTAARELREETGYIAGHLEPLGYVLSTPGFCTERIWLYLATELEQVGQDLDEDEFLEVFRLPLAQVKEQVLSGELSDGKTVAGILRAAARLGV